MSSNKGYDVTSSGTNSQELPVGTESIEGGPLHAFPEPFNKIILTRIRATIIAPETTALVPPTRTAITIRTRKINTTGPGVLLHVNGSYYYSNPNGSTYYNNGSGGSTYTPSSNSGSGSGSSSKK
ncbi:hypothetical protein N7533_006640 [Penicillium manginii]|uniref:uncharacterized protein n=1 Tax=Penicillium manginii TaxID=203109 RepID=UPI00254871FD|nr:uncharacterized protein N7533_006640 [Penicillium manginii]KAJ5749612.1 hypothetical protein N7533_006640 [Penicillium manginii]